MPDLRKAYQELDPASGHSDETYVGRPGDPMGLLAEELKLKSSPYRVLLTGQRGVGKSTELKRLFTRIKPERNVLAYNIDQIVVGDATNAFLNMARTLAKSAGLPDESKESQKIKELTARPREKVTIREAKFLVKAILKAVGEKASHLVYLLDGFEKGSAAEIATVLVSLVDLDCSFVIVVPVEIMLSPEYAAIVSEWDRLIALPAIPVRDRAGNPDVEGLGILHAIVERRAGKDAFEKAALDRVVHASGGIHRDLLTLAQQACLRAAVAGRSFVSEIDASSAVEDRLQEYSFHLTPADVAYLELVSREQRISADPRTLPLVNRNLIVSYRGDWSWFTAHPIIEPLLSKLKGERRS